MGNRLLGFFDYEHLPPALQTISQPCGDLADLVDKALVDGPEKDAGLRKLLEAKDCFVRAQLEQIILEDEVDRAIAGEIIDAEFDWTCSKCGCTATKPCADKSGQPCSWAAADLCSACAAKGGDV